MQLRSILLLHAHLLVTFSRAPAHVVSELKHPADFVAAATLACRKLVPQSLEACIKDCNTCLNQSHWPLVCQAPGDKPLSLTLKGWRTFKRIGLGHADIYTTASAPASVIYTTAFAPASVIGGGTVSESITRATAAAWNLAGSTGHTKPLPCILLIETIPGPIAHCRSWLASWQHYSVSW